MLLLAREVDELLHLRAVGDRRRRVVRERAEQHARPRLRQLPRLLDACDEVDVGPDRHALHRCAREPRREEMDRIARARDERDVARAEQHPEEMHEPFLRAERHRRLGLGIELDAVPVAVQLAHRGAQIRQAAARRVAVVARQQRGLAQLLDGDLRRRDVGVAEAEVDHVLAGAAQLELQALDLGEGVRGKRVDRGGTASRGRSSQSAKRFADRNDFADHDERRCRQIRGRRCDRAERRRDDLLALGRAATR